MTDSTSVALITGAARRIGAALAQALHAAGRNVVIHCRDSSAEAQALAARLNATRADSAHVAMADLRDPEAIETLVLQASNRWGRLDVLINNASLFQPTPFGRGSVTQWDDVLNVNLRAPFLLCQAAAPFLKTSRGAIINLVDIHGERPHAGHSVYSISKAGLHMLTRALATELAPQVRVNGISPGAILWPESGSSEADRERILAETPLRRTGTPQDIADAVLFLVRAEFVTGQVLAVDGGRSV